MAVISCLDYSCIVLTAHSANFGVYSANISQRISLKQKANPIIYLIKSLWWPPTEFLPQPRRAYGSGAGYLSGLIRCYSSFPCSAPVPSALLLSYVCVDMLLPQDLSTCCFLEWNALLRLPMWTAFSLASGLCSNYYEKCLSWSLCLKCQYPPNFLILAYFSLWHILHITDTPNKYLLSSLALPY